MPQDTYSTAQAARLAGASKPAVRAYAAKYSAWLSPEATPEPGHERRFTVDDLRLLRFVFERTQAKDTHAVVLARIASGELDSFTWTPAEPQDAAEEPVDSTEGSRTAPSALMTQAQVQALKTLLEDAHRREQDAKERERELQEQLATLQHALGQAQGELEARKRRRPGWLRSLLGE